MFCSNIHRNQHQTVLAEAWGPKNALFVSCLIDNKGRFWPLSHAGDMMQVCMMSSYFSLCILRTGSPNSTRLIVGQERDMAAAFTALPEGMHLQQLCESLLPAGCSFLCSGSGLDLKKKHFQGKRKINLFSYLSLEGSWAHGFLNFKFNTASIERSL